MLCPNCDHEIRTENVICAGCDTLFPRVIKMGRPVIYCSKECKERSRARKAALV